MHTGFSRVRSGGLVLPSFSEFSTAYCEGPLDESERGELKSWLKAQHSEN